MLKPVFTEKSLKMAKLGAYTFWVDVKATKPGIKAMVARIFGVHVQEVKTVKKAGESGRNARGKHFVKLASKKAMIRLKNGEKLDIFEESKSK